jgi:hypothetical protein
MQIYFEGVNWIEMVVDGFQGSVVPAHDIGLQFCDAKDRVHSAFFAPFYLVPGSQPEI